mmetsp:Transcript_6636/g.17859  ORF Transcript_6636/g.17859 Transcript_6636/m.17859 type:complete len:307 (-) Transcript_6636:112-1032(-)|eukprot:CAMPEP_0185835742 /NCGR_PEP_ID=MMETSP1353-20130828/8356_1 /TAXON_ID=1077150 /ORGANISM="Erythrolobus australicus, Strain CCMP3124" /LENGTH=306 /DNA_ID=CAMNT_0028534415 /DNA_START=243 /DNA_END=1163 /DNA_ORIENTATION=-
MASDSSLMDTIHAHGYRLQKKINSGAQGSVYTAYDRSRGCKVAVKIMKRASKSTHRELFAIQKLSHDSIAKVVDVFHCGESSVLVMEHFSGGDLFEWLTGETFIDAESLYTVARHMLRALVYMHGCNMAHRDLKLENVVLAQKGDASTLHLIDFGFSISASRGELYSADYSGTLSYQPPEQIHKLPFSPLKGDMWSLGVLLYTLLFKRLPFGDSKDPRTKLRITQRRPAIDPHKCPHVSQRFLLLIQMLLNPIADCRPTASEALSMVEDIMARQSEPRKVEASELKTQTSAVSDESTPHPPVTMQT